MRISDVNETDFASGYVKDYEKIEIKNEKDSKIKVANDHLKNICQNSNNESNISLSKSKRPTSSYLVFNSRPFSKIKKVVDFSNHVGMGFSNRNMIFVENNNIQKIPVSSLMEVNKKSISKSENMFGNSNMFYNGDIKSLKLIGEPSNDNRVNKLLSKDKFGKAKYSLEDLKNYIAENDKASSHYLNFVDKNKLDDDEMIKFYKAKRRELIETQDKILKTGNMKSTMITKKLINSKQKIKNSPIGKNSINQTFISNNVITDNNIDNNHQEVLNTKFDLYNALFPFAKDCFNSVNKNDIMYNNLHTDSISPKEKISNKFIKSDDEKDKIYNKNDTFKDRSLLRDNVTVRCSSPYQIEKDFINREERQSKSKWLVGKEFKRYFGNKYKISFEKNLNIQSPYVSPSSHKFRTDEKNKWISKQKFL